MNGIHPGGRTARSYEDRLGAVGLGHRRPWAVGLTGAAPCADEMHSIPVGHWAHGSTCGLTAWPPPPHIHAVSASGCGHQGKPASGQGVSVQLSQVSASLLLFPNKKFKKKSSREDMTPFVGRHRDSWWYGHGMLTPVHSGGGSLGVFSFLLCPFSELKKNFSEDVVLQ